MTSWLRIVEVTKPPAFQFYARDFYMGSATMGAAAVGAYIRSLAWSWDNGPLPADHALWAKLVFLTPAEFKRIWPELKTKFTKGDHGYTNDRLEGERSKQDAYREKQAAKGRHSAQQRFNRGSTVVTTAVQPEHQPEGNHAPGLRLQPEGQPEGNSSSSSSSSQVQNQKQRSAPVSLDEVRSHLKAACYRLITSDPDCHHSSPFQISTLSERLKTIAARDLKVADYNTREIDKIISAVLANPERVNA